MSIETIQTTFFQFSDGLLETEMSELIDVRFELERAQELFRQPIFRLNLDHSEFAGECPAVHNGLVETYVATFKLAQAASQVAAHSNSESVVPVRTADIADLREALMPFRGFWNE